MRIETLNRVDTGTFIKMLDGIFEDSSWIVAKTAALRPFVSFNILFEAMASIVTSASDVQKEALINAHPRLGSADKLTRNSSGEQQRAGLRNLEEEEAATFATLNAEYEKAFDFPFIMAVKGRTKADIYTSMKKRLTNTKTEEFDTAIEEILKIAKFRMNDLQHDEY